MAREIKFRVWNPDHETMYDGPFMFQPSQDCDHVETPFTYYYDWRDFEDGIKRPCHVMQFTGLKDKNGVEIYEGDRLLIRRPYRTTQTHFGDNIPNGSYTEPMEPGIKETEFEVAFKDGMFVLTDEGGDYDNVPMSWMVVQYDEDSIQANIGKPRNDQWDDPEEGDFQYLLELSKKSTLGELIKHLSGCEVIGNIYQNPELLNTKP